MSRNRNERYYDDSDDMVERIRRAREAFEKKANAFQGPDWPYYDKRIIQGKKTKEEFLAAQAKADSTVTPASTETTTTSSQPNTVPENAQRQLPIKHPHGGRLSEKLLKPRPPPTRMISQPR